jgi:two-component system, NarL family, response regulator DevR
MTPGDSTLPLILSRAGDGMAIRVLLVDDHEIVRTGLRAVIAAEPDLLVAGEAATGEAAIALAGQLQPAVVLMDVRLGDLDGIQACRVIKSRDAQIAVLFLTSFGTEEAILAALMAGASGFLLKNTRGDDIVRAIRLVAAGQSLLDPEVTSHVTKKLVALASEAAPPELRDISPREREVLVRIAHGDTNRQIADRLVISELTARNHVSHVLEKLGMTRRSEAAALAARLGLLEDR